MAINSSQGRISLRRAGTTCSISSSSPLRLSSPSSSPSLSLSLASPLLNSKPTLPIVLALLLILQLPQPTSATPLQLNTNLAPRSSRTTSTPLLLIPRADGDGQPSSSGSGVNIITIIVPVVVVVSLFFVLLLVMMLRRKPKWKAYLKRAFKGNVLAVVPEERAMTATANATPATTGAGGTTIATGLGVGGREQTEIERQRAIILADARRNQRAERARRQGSQRSVKSLPVYRQDLDDSEMVLVKGDDQLQDDEIESPRSSHDLADDYPRGSRSHDEDPELDPPTSAPLLSNDGRPSNEEHPDSLTSRINVIPSSAPASATRFDARSASVSTMDTFRQGGSSDGGSHADLIHHGWGEAPSYDVESFGGGSGGREEIIISSGASTPSRIEEGVAVASGSAEVNRRQSGFSRFFTRKPSASTSTSGPTSYPPLPSSTQTLSTASGSRSTHRPSFSASSSTLNLPFGNNNNSSLSLLHPVSTRRSSDANRLTSPSLLSISAPLTDTLVKTQFAPPSSGWSAEQMKFISSTENLGKYAVPYGPSSTRRSMDSRRRSGEEEAPPPAFDDSSDTSPRIDGLPSSTFSPYPTPSPEASSSGLPSSSTPPPLQPTEETSTNEPTPPSSPTASTPYPPVVVPEATATTTTITFSPALSVIPATPITPVSGAPHSAA